MARHKLGDLRERSHDQNIPFLDNMLETFIRKNIKKLEINSGNNKKTNFPRWKPAFLVFFPSFPVFLFKRFLALQSQSPCCLNQLKLQALGLEISRPARRLRLFFYLVCFSKVFPCFSLKRPS